MTSGAAVFPATRLQLESVTPSEKARLKRVMDDKIRTWPCPKGLTRSDLLLVHSRVVTAEWVMMTFDMEKPDDATKKVGGDESRGFTVTIDKMGVVELTSQESLRGYAIEHGVDIAALSQVGTPAISSHCVFLGAFRARASPGSWTVEDTAASLWVRVTILYRA